MILTHILHEVHPDIHVEPGTNEESTFVQNVLTPIVIELINNDIAPAIPVCHYPDGSTPAADGSLAADADEEVAEEERVLPDSWDVVRRAMEVALGELDLPEGMNADDLINEALSEQDIVTDMNIESEDGQETLSLVIQGLRSSVSEHIHQSNGTDETLAEVDDAITQV